ncbi:hypothetical protein DFJ74DRAFT_62968 [Hyaloraphidium curvatum]|nr:hypothetical protein DFJ74DRAFT_62968 [Hyaloraphidium curvatum]
MPREKAAKDAGAKPKKRKAASAPAKVPDAPAGVPAKPSGGAPPPRTSILGSVAVDPKLDALFANAVPSILPKPVVKLKAAPTEPSPRDPGAGPAERKRKRDREEAPAKEGKRGKGADGAAKEAPASSVEEPGPKPKKIKDKHREKLETAASRTPSSPEREQPPPRKKKEKKKRKPDDETAERLSEPRKDSDGWVSEDGAGGDESPERKKKERKSAKDDPKNSRTVFVGNLTTKVLEKPVLKTFKKRMSEFGTVESIRFRSVAFAKMLPKKVAFLSKALHPDRDTLNAYVVYADESGARAAAAGLNGTVFEDKHLRADMAGNTGKQSNSRTVFVGNLPFGIGDEDLWAHFADAGEIEGVRVVRDGATQVGKGFAYVTFKERLAMELALDLDGSELAKRKIRVTRSVKKKKTAPTRAKERAEGLTGAQRRLALAGKPFEGQHAAKGSGPKPRGGSKGKGGKGKGPKFGKRKPGQGARKGKKPGDKSGKKPRK